MHAELIGTGQTYKCDKCEEDFAATDFRADTARYMGTEFDLSNYVGIEYLGEHYGQGNDDGHCNMVYVEAGQTITFNTDSMGSTENVWYCGDGCFHHDEGEGPNLVDNEVWACGDCEEQFDGSSYVDPKAEAVGCCK